jgi:flagellar biosynthesis/type III secretory pathway protein FliH
VTDFRVKMTVPPRGLKVVAPGDPWPPPAPARHASTPTAKPAAGDAGQAEAARQMAADREFLESTLGQLGQTLQDLYADRHKQLTDLQNLAVELAIVAAGRLLFRDLDEDRFAVEEMVRDMAKQLVDDKPVAIHLNPKDLHLMQRRLGSRLLFADDDAAPKLVPDSGVDRGACVVEGTKDSFAHDPAAELSRMREELLERMAHARS